MHARTHIYENMTGEIIMDNRDRGKTSGDHWTQGYRFRHEWLLGSRSLVQIVKRTVKQIPWSRLQNHADCKAISWQNSQTVKQIPWSRLQNSQTVKQIPWSRLQNSQTVKRISWYRLQNAQTVQASIIWKDEKTKHTNFLTWDVPDVRP